MESPCQKETDRSFLVVIFAGHWDWGWVTGMDESTPGRRSGLAPAKKEGLLSLVNYQPGSVVSREIFSQGAGTVTLFAFDVGEALSEHTSPFSALLYVLEGQAVVKVEGIESEVGETEAILLPAGKPHALSAKKRFKMLLIMIRK